MTGAGELLPAEIRINAWAGGAAAHGALGPEAVDWGAGGGLPHTQQPLALDDPVDPTDWSHPDVGYGVLLPDDPTMSTADKAVGAHAPGPVRELLARRPGTVVLGWAASDELGDDKLWRYFPDGRKQAATIGLSDFGVDKGHLPRYVLIVGGPDVVPWSVQYALGTRHAVGRLPFTGEALRPYVEAMLDGWPDVDVDVRAPLMWTVDLPGDITAEMRVVIADPLAVKLTDPSLPRFAHLAGAAATAPALLDGLRAKRPALVVTSSHGMTGAGAAELGLPVDQRHATVGLADLDAAMPPGAIWHTQACCSAGSESPSRYTGLLAPATSAATTVAAVADLGATVAPAVLALLGRARPVRAVLGHVEPTFDWTLRVAETGQGLGHHIVNALSSNLYNGQPVGYAFAEYRTGVGELHTAWQRAFDRLSQGRPEMRPRLTRLRLTAVDRQSLVLLGDPTVTLPPRAGAP